MISEFDKLFESLMNELDNKRKFKVSYGNRHGAGSTQFFTVVDAGNEEEARQIVGKSLEPHDVIEKVELYSVNEIKPILTDVAVQKVNIPDGVYKNCSRHADIIELHYPDAKNLNNIQTSFKTKNNIADKSGNCDIRIHDGIVDILRNKIN